MIVSSLCSQDLPRLLTTHSVVTPPHNVSNLRRVFVKTPKDETKPERTYRWVRGNIFVLMTTKWNILIIITTSSREAYEDVQQWNHKYWVAHNELFQRERARYVLENTKADNPQQLDANQMAVFYRQFLNDNQDKHWKWVILLSSSSTYQHQMWSSW